MESKLIQVGDSAPDFVLKDHQGNAFSLSEFRGKKVLLSFHPLAWTAVCALQMQSLDNNYTRFEELNTLPVGVSIDTIQSKAPWADELQIEKLRLLADFWPHGELARKLGIFREKDGFSERANILIDEAGQVAFVKVYEIKQLPDVEELIRELQ